MLPQISGVEVAPCLLPKISGVEVTPSVTSVESFEQFWRKIRQIWRICEPCYRLASYLLADNWLICRLHMQCMISKCDVKLVRCDDVFVVIYTMYNKTVIRFGFCDFRNNQGLGTCKFYQPWPLALPITCTSTLIIPDITKASSNNHLKLF